MHKRKCGKWEIVANTLQKLLQKFLSKVGGMGNIRRFTPDKFNKLLCCSVII